MLLTRVWAGAAALLAASVLITGPGWFAPQASLRAAGADNASAEQHPELVSGEANAVRLPAEAVATLGIQTGVAKRRGVERPRELVLAGSLAFDPARVSRVRTLVAPATVVEIAKVPMDRVGRVEVAEIGTGARVKKGELLAVLQSPGVAAKQSDLVEALVQLHLDRDILDRAEKAEGALPERVLLNARRAVQNSSNAVNRAEQTLRAWQIPDAEIQVVKTYAEKATKGKRDKEVEKAWGRVDARAPRDGTIIEKNVTAGEVLVDGTSTLFTLADPSRLQVMVNADEDDLPALLELKPDQRRWTIRLVGQQPLEGQIEQIGHLIDSHQHTATLTGTVSNPEGRLRAGQFVTVAIALPGAVQELVVPVSALVEAGREAFLFVQADPAKLVYAQRRANVVRRGHDTAHVRFFSKPDERIVTAGALDLKAILDDLKAAQK